MRIVSLQHVPIEGPAMITEWAQERGHTLQERKVYAGAQLMESALGAKVNPMGYREIGWRPVKGGDSLLTVFHWHEDTFDIPAGGTRIFGNDACENQGFRYGNATALQFHLEMDIKAVQRLRNAGRAEIGDSLDSGERYVQTAETILSEAPDRERSLRPVLYALLDSLFT